MRSSRPLHGRPYSWFHCWPLSRSPSGPGRALECRVGGGSIARVYDTGQDHDHHEPRLHKSHRKGGDLEDREPRVVRALLETRGRHPNWGAKKLPAYLASKHPSWTLPAKSTAHDILRRNNLVPRRRTRRRPGHPGRPLTGFTEPNRIWTADFKGQFKTRDGVYCYPLTIQDGYSRFLLACQGLPGTRFEATKRVLTGVFRT